jgi:hypothetical protein
LNAVRRIFTVVRKLRNSRGRFSFADSHSPEPDGFSVVRGFAHATVVPADDAGGHRHRHGAEVQRNRLLRVDTQLRPRLHWKLPVNFCPFINFKLVYNGHPWDLKIVAIVDWWSLLSTVML